LNPNGAGSSDQGDHATLQINPEQIVALAKDYYGETRKWIGKRDLQKELKGGYRLHSQAIQVLTD
jgi:hypothetical protein